MDEIGDEIWTCRISSKAIMIDATVSMELTDLTLLQPGGRNNSSPDRRRDTCTLSAMSVEIDIEIQPRWRY